MSHDPKTLFIVSAFSRAEIAEELNNWLKTYEPIVDKDSRILTEDDDRLTDELCQQFATRVGEIDEDASEEWRRDEFAYVCYQTMYRANGLPCDEHAYDETWER